MKIANYSTRPANFDSIKDIKKFRINTSLAPTINYINFDYYVHETSSQEQILFKYNVDYKYNFYFDKYEESIKNSPNSETILNNFYEIYRKSKENKKQFDLQLEDDFKIDFTNNTTTKFYYPYENINFNEMLQEANSRKEKLYFYNEIQFDDINTTKYENSFRELFEEYSLFSNYFKQIDTDTNNLNNFFTNITDIKFQLKLADLIEKNKLNFFDAINNKKTYKEAIGYRIQKFVENNRNPIQEFYVPSTNQQKINFIDTQIYYGKKYTYKISYIFIVVSKFLGVNINQKQYKENYSYPYGIIIDPNIQYSGYVLDKPPLPPSVEFIPYVGATDKVKINLNSSIGSVLDNLNIINANETQSFNKIKEAQGNRADGKILFSSDEPSKKFYMYRLDRQPNSYSDFSNVLPVEIKYSSYNDTALQLNKKYYYVFRSVDVHDHFSNPSDVYEYEIINDAGAIYSVLNVKKINDYENINFKDTTKKLKKYLMFKPMFTNLELANGEQLSNLTDKTQILQQAKIGVNDKNVWDRKFKIRITSLSSGKKIDLNIKYNIEKINK